jgi:hypothetical protein
MTASTSQQRSHRAVLFLLMALTTGAVVASLGASIGRAQQSKGPPNALQGFSTNRGAPVRIVTRPPDGIASRALMHRFMTTCST